MKHISEDIGKLRDSFCDQPKGVTTGFAGLDTAIWGLQPGQLITVGGRPAMGKTGVMVDIALSASQESPVGIFSFEMPFDRLQARMCANLADLNYRNVRAGDTTDEQKDLFFDAAEDLKHRPIHIIDEPCFLGIDQYWLKQRKVSVENTMDFKIKTLVKDKGCKVIMVDYLQLITQIDKSMKDRRIVVGSITEQLRNYAKQYNFSLVLLCQLRRFEQARYGGKKKISPLPTLDDLKESGEIENHSDIVILLHRPEYYNDTKDINLTDNTVENDALLMIRKNRDGPTGNVPVEWHSFSMSYRDFQRNKHEY